MLGAAEYDALERGLRVNGFFQLPLEVRLALLAVLGAVVGTQVNRGIYRLAWFPRPIGPWSAPDPAVPPRRAADRLPLLGWFGLRRESSVHGAGFWVRPLLIELAMAAGFAGMYWYEVDQSVLLRRGVDVAVSGLSPVEIVHWQYFSHLALVSLMMVATFIDFDEQTIPDTITVPGVWLGLAIAAIWPGSRTVVQVPAGEGVAEVFLHLGSGSARPGDAGWPAALHAAPGLFFGLACWFAWCVALIPTTWTMRRGWRMAWRFWCASLARNPWTPPVTAMGAVGAVALTGVWFAGGVRWESLLSALVGMAAGGAMIWGVRVVGGWALKQEAMGFGDVTLMAMIGSFTGWQPTLLIFFLAPFSAVVIAVIQFAITRRHDIAFGPYLCLGTMAWLLFPDWLWGEYGRDLFSMGWVLPLVGCVGLLLMGLMLHTWRLIRP